MLKGAIFDNLGIDNAKGLTMQGDICAVFGAINASARINNALQHFIDSDGDELSCPKRYLYENHKMATGMVADDLIAANDHPHEFDTRLGRLTVVSNPFNWGNYDFRCAVDWNAADDIDEAVQRAVARLSGFCIVMTSSKMYVARSCDCVDPIFIGRDSHGIFEQSHGFASSHATMNALGMTYWKCLGLGDMIVLSKQRAKIVRPWQLYPSDSVANDYSPDGCFAAYA